MFSGSIGDAAKDSFCANDPSNCLKCFPVLSRNTEWVPLNVRQLSFYLISLQFLPWSMTLTSVIFLQLRAFLQLAFPADCLCSCKTLLKHLFNDYIFGCGCKVMLGSVS